MLDGKTFSAVLRSATNTLLFLLGIPMVVLLALVFLLYRSFSWVDHTDRVIAEANRTEKLLFTMQSSFRGFRLSQQETSLKPYLEARAVFPAQLKTLSSLTADNPSRLAMIANLRSESTAWLGFTDTQLAGVRAGTLPPNDPSFSAVGRPVFQRTQTILDDFIEREEVLRSAREKNLSRWGTVLVVIFGLVALLGIPALARWMGQLLRRVSVSYQSALSAAEQRAKELQVTMNSIGDAVVATDDKGRVEFLNPIAEHLTGWVTTEARGQPLPEVFEIFNEQSRQVVENPVERVLKENVIVGLANHTILRARDGTERPIEDSAAPIRGDDGSVRGVILVFHDVTAKREKARLLEESEERLRVLNDLSEATRALLDPVEIMAVATRQLGLHLRVSRCAYAEVAEEGDEFTILQDYTNHTTSTVGKYQLSLFGPRAAEKMRTGNTLVIHDVDAELEPGRGADMFNAIGVKAIVCFPLVKEGGLRAMMAVHQTQPRRWTSAEIKLVGEVVERSWATIERAKAEAATREATARVAAAAREVAESAGRFQLLAEVVSLQVWTANLRGELDYANLECAHYFGVDLEREVLGHGWAQFVHLDDLPEALRSWQSSLASGERYEVEFRLRDKNGQYRWFLVRAQAMRDEHGQIAKWFGTNTDIDALKRAQGDAERASRAKDDFIATLSHELRTPLTPVLMTAAALRDDQRLSPETREQLSMMERNIALEARLIDDLLDVTTITRGKLRLRAQASDAHSLIGLAAEIVRDDALAKEIIIDRKLSATRTGLVVDPARFQQVIWNLLRNAVKFTPRGGRIQLQTQDHVGVDGSPWFKVAIIDSGIGIATAELEKIFLPFEQGQHAGDHRFGGIGLGLAIARAIVDLHGGRISASSEGANRGSTFVVELPGAAEPPHGVSAQNATTPAPFLGVPSATPPPTIPVSKQSYRLLLVEDHEATLQVLSRLLAAAGHRVTTARTITDAAEIATKEKFDLVISDLGLPDGTGAELMEKLRENYGLRGIALSGYGMEEDIARSREAGFTAHLIKPVDFAQLRRVLAEVMN